MKTALISTVVAMIISVILIGHQHRRELDKKDVEIIEWMMKARTSDSEVCITRRELLQAYAMVQYQDSELNKLSIVMIEHFKQYHQ